VGTAADRTQGRKERQSIALWLADVLSDPSAPLTTEQLNHYRMVLHWFPDGQEALDRIERIYREDRPEIADELYISLVCLCLDRILSDTRPKTATGAVKRQPVKKKSVKSTLARFWRSAMLRPAADNRVLEPFMWLLLGVGLRAGERFACRVTGLSVKKGKSLLPARSG
jgi:hypothetical protein